MWQFLITIGRAGSIFLGCFNKLKSVWIRIYTGLYSAKFHSFGNNSLIVPCCSEILGMNVIDVGDNCILGRDLILTAYKSYHDQTFSPTIHISDSVSLGCRNHITCINHIYIGKNVLTGPDVLITDNSHGRSEKNDITLSPLERMLISKGPVIIEDNVWIGEKASIMPNVRIGKGSIVACNSVVTKNVPPNCIVAGSPAKIIKFIQE